MSTTASHKAKAQPQIADFSNISSDLLKLLAEIGFLGISKGLTNQPKDIFSGIIAVRPDDPNAFLGKAIADTLAGNVSEGSEALNAILKNDPKNDIAKSFLALAFFMKKDYTEVKKLAKCIIEANADANAVAMANGLLEQMKNVK